MVAGISWELEFNRPTQVLISLVPAIVNIIIFFYTTIKFPKSKLNSILSILILLLSIWQISETFVLCSVHQEAAFVWFRMGGVASTLVTIFNVLFALRYSGWDKKIPSILFLLLLYLPAIAILMAIVGRVDQYIWTNNIYWHCLFTPVPNSFASVLYGWISFWSFSTLLIFWFYYLPTKRKHQAELSEQTLIIAVGYTIPILGGIIVEVILPLFYGRQEIPVTVSLITFFSLASFIAIKQYGLLTFSPRYQWEKILESMTEGLIIVDNDDKIMYVNQQFAEMLGYSSNELVGTTANHLITDIESLEKVSKAILERQDKKSSHYQVLMNKKMGIGFGCT